MRTDLQETGPKTLALRERERAASARGHRLIAGAGLALVAGFAIAVVLALLMPGAVQRCAGISEGLALGLLVFVGSAMIAAVFGLGALGSFAYAAATRRALDRRPAVPSARIARR